MVSVPSSPNQNHLKSRTLESIVMCCWKGRGASLQPPKILEPWLAPSQALSVSSSSSETRVRGGPTCSNSPAWQIGSPVGLQNIPGAPSEIHVYMGTCIIVEGQ